MKFLVSLVLVFLLSASIHGQERRLALVIGNGNYLGSTLANPENDARSMGKALKDIGFEVILHENIGQKDMARAIDDFGNRLRDYDLGLFYYAGHGIQSNGYNYLMPVDAKLTTESDVEFNCVRADRVLGKMEDAKNSLNIVIMDACRDNPFERSWTRNAKGRGLATMSAPMGSLLGFATSPGTTASDGAGANSPYTSGLLKYLNEPGITAIQMLQKVTAHVIKVSKGQQLPWVSSSLTADFYLVPGTAKAGPDNENYSIDELQKVIDDHSKRSDGEISLAILPFNNLTGDREQEYIVKGQNDALYTELCKLGQVKPIRVVGGRTAAALSNSDMSIPEIARKFNVDFLVEASVMIVEDSIVLHLRLIEAYPEERPIFATTYSSDFVNILKLHSNIAGQIAEKINMKLSPQNLVAISETRSVNPEAYKEYLRGMYQIGLMTPEAMDLGIKHLHNAIKIDPGEAFSYAGLALGYLDLAHSVLDPGDALIKAEAAVTNALLIDPTLPEVYASLAEVYFYRTFEFDKAEKFFKKALELNPNLANTHYHYSWLLYVLDRMEEAIVEHKLAQKYDPFNPRNTAWLGGLYSYEDRFEEGIKECMDAMEMNKDYPITYYVLGDCFRGLGRYDKAIETHKKLRELQPNWTWPLVLTYMEVGMKDEAEELLVEYIELGMEEFEPFKALNLSIINGALGNLDEAFKWLNHKPIHVWVVVAGIWPDFKSLHNDPRLELFLEEFSFPKKK